MQKLCALFSIPLIIACLAVVFGQPGPSSSPATTNLAVNPDFRQKGVNAQQPASYQLTGDARYRYLGDPAKDVSAWGVALPSAPSSGHHDAVSASVSQSITGIDAKAGRWFRFSFRGLARDDFSVTDDGLYMKAEFFADSGKTSFDGKEKHIYAGIEQDRRDLSVNGDRKVGGAAVWRTYSMDFMLPFPQVDQVKLTVGCDHGNATSATGSEFLITDFSLVRIDEPAGVAATQPMASQTAIEMSGEKLPPIGGRWFYKPAAGETRVPAKFDSNNVDRLLYHDGKYTAPFAGMTTAWLRAGDKDLKGVLVSKDQFIADNVTISFDSTSMIIHSRNLPNHPTGKFPETGVSRGNPNYIQEKQNTFYIPLNPRVNAKNIVTATDNSNHALPMGPIGVAVNGVVFFNPFDAGSQDATNMMDRCCGHPAPDGTYHYHKYPICINSPWMDEGEGHSPLIGWAFDGFPVYGPYEKAGVMAKDITGESALNDFNLHYDADRGWHYHVTPGKFPYIVGGYWGTEDTRDSHGPGGGGRGPGGMGPPGGMGDGPPRRGPGNGPLRGPGNGPPSGGPGRDLPPPPGN